MIRAGDLARTLTSGGSGVGSEGTRMSVSGQLGRDSYKSVITTSRESPYR
jgi:hypothetical protein